MPCIIRGGPIARRLHSSTRQRPPSCRRHRHSHPHIRRGQRGIVTASIPPSLGINERPEIIVLVESAIYRHSWHGYSSKFYPSLGMHYSSIDITKPPPTAGGVHSQQQRTPPLKLLEQIMADDLSHLSDVSDMGGTDNMHVPGHTTTTSAHAVMIARGPLQCVVAQYFVESLPLAGLVLVDPLLLPDDGRAGTMKSKSNEYERRWETSLSDLTSLLANEAPSLYVGTSHLPYYPSDNSPLQLADTNISRESFDSELSILHALENDRSESTHARPLRLEPGSVPLLVCYSGGHKHHDYYRICSERTAAFHTCGGLGDYFDQVPVLMVHKKEDGTDDLDRLSKSIYEWYDQVVA